MTKHLTLQDRLAKSLDSVNKREQRHEPRPAQKRAHKPKPASHAGTVKLSISLFPSDMEALEAIRSHMAKRGYRISTSQAVKLALRTAPLSDGMADTLTETHKEDGRRAAR